MGRTGGCRKEYAGDGGDRKDDQRYGARWISIAIEGEPAEVYQYWSMVSVVVGPPPNAIRISTPAVIDGIVVEIECTDDSEK